MKLFQLSFKISLLVIFTLVHFLNLCLFCTTTYYRDIKKKLKKKIPTTNVLFHKYVPQYTIVKRNILRVECSCIERTADENLPESLFFMSTWRVFCTYNLLSTTYLLLILRFLFFAPATLLFECNIKLISVSFTYFRIDFDDLSSCFLFATFILNQTHSGEFIISNIVTNSNPPSTAFHKNW